MQSLLTAVGESLCGKPWDIYPRPQMRRKNYVNLNGEWDFTVTQSDERPEAFERKILVPFCPESMLSGINEHYPEGSRLWYSTSFVAPEGERVLLHIDGIDQTGTLFINGKKLERTLCTCLNGRETVDITSYIEERNTLELCITDNLNDKSYPYGKQTLNRGGMWYTPVSGIWQTVWLEAVPEKYIENLKITPSDDSVLIEIFGAECGTVSCEGREYKFSGGRLVVSPENVRQWTPETPYLYDFTVRAGEDEVQSYFALRTVDIRNVDGRPRICLNGKPYFFHGLLDQGYWPDGIYTPPTAECYADDILDMKALGFNTLRKHIKVEPDRFYYDCDRLGMVVFQDMVNNGSYRFIRDTALPTVGLQRMADKNLNRDENCRNAFLKAMQSEVRALYNHPSVCYWTIFNEGWGQFESAKAYDELHSLDATRIIDSTSGWFRGEKTDVESRHVYFRRFKMPKSDKPVVLSEFGGYVYKDAEHSFNPDKTYGYRFFKSIGEFNIALEKLYRKEIIPAVKSGLCAAIYTQVSDVEDETNGLLSYDRKLCKADTQMMLKVADDIKKELQP